MNHLLVTNDYPPKVGGIQSYLWELWRRLPTGRCTILTCDHPGAGAFDAQSPHHTVRVPARVLLPTPQLAKRVRLLAKSVKADLVVLDPALPVGLLGPALGLPYAVVLHGAEVTVPGHLPGLEQLLRRVISRAALVIAAGDYPAGEARRVAGRAMPAVVVIPPGVDVQRFQPLEAGERSAVRGRLGLPTEGQLIVSVSRLVPRKGMDVLIEAAARLAVAHPDLTVAIGGSGRDTDRLKRLIARTAAPVRLLGRVDDADLPALTGAADVWAMLCRNRWGGLEQEGFGIVFLEAAACGVPQVAGASGGAGEAVIDGVTGVVVDRPADVVVASQAIGQLLDDPQRRAKFGAAARSHAVAEFDYDVLAHRLDEALLSADAEPDKMSCGTRLVTCYKSVVSRDRPRDVLGG